jgi:hypothetical protein
VPPRPGGCSYPPAAFPTVRRPHPSPQHPRLGPHHSRHLPSRSCRHLGHKCSRHGRRITAASSPSPQPGVTQSQRGRARSAEPLPGRPDQASASRSVQRILHDLGVTSPAMLERASARADGSVARQHSAGYPGLKRVLRVTSPMCETPDEPRGRERAGRVSPAGILYGSG